MASKTNISDYRFSIFINNDQAKRSLIEMEKTMMGYEANLKRLEAEGKKNSEEYRSGKLALDKLKETMHETRKAAGLQALSLKELKALQMQLNAEWARSIPGTQHRKMLEKELGAVTARITELKTGAQQSGMSLGKMADGFNRYFSMVTAGVAAFAGLALSIKSMITVQGELSDSLANIRKSTGMTADEVEGLNVQLGKLNTRTSRQELRDMAVVAGQLGMAKEDVFSFVESVDKLNVALGDEFTGGAEEVAKQMGMLRNVLTDNKTANVADDMMRLGNAVNTLGAAGFATGPVMADFASRIGGIGVPLGLTSDEVLGLSATLQELNVNAERGGTAVVKILQKMTTNTEAFAGIAGVPVKEFTDLVNSDLYGAFMKVIEGSQRGGQSATALAGIIKELEITGVGASEIFAKLGTNTDMLAEKTRLAGDALQGTDSITNEFNIKNATLGATLAKLQKDFYSLITMPGITNFFKNQVYNVVELVNWLKDLPLIIEKYRIAILALVTVAGYWILAQTKTLQVTLLNNLMLKEGILLKAKDAIMMQLLIAKEELYAIWKGRGTIASKLAATAQWAWNAAVAANPLGAIFVAIMAVVGAMEIYSRNNAQAIKLENDKKVLQQNLVDLNKQLADSYAEVNEQIRIMNRLSMEEKKNIRDKIDLQIEQTRQKLLELRQTRDQVATQAAYNPSFFSAAGHALSTGFGLWGSSVEDFRREKYNEASGEFAGSLSEIEASLKRMQESRKTVDDILNAESDADKVSAKTYEALSEKLSLYQTALRNTTAKSEEYNRIQNKIKQVNKELAQFDNSEKSGEGSDKVKTRLEQLNKKIEEYMALLQKQVDTDPKKAAITAAEIKRLEAQKKALDDLIKSYLEKDKADNTPFSFGAEQYSTNYEEIYKFRKEIGVATADEIYNYEIYKLQQTKAWAIASEEERAAAILKIRKEVYKDASFLPDGTMIEEWDPENYQQDKAKRDKAQEETQKKDTQTGALGVDMWGAKAEQFMGYANTVLNGLMSIDQLMSQHENAQLAKDQFTNDEKKKNLKRQLDAKRITQKQYDAQIAKMDAEMDQKKRELQVKQAKRQKALSLAQAIINTAQAVTSALSAGPIIGIILAALVGILGAVQIGYIASQPIPEAAKGRYKAFLKARQAAMGRYDVLGADDNKMYRGIPYVEKPASGLYTKPTLFAETGDEIILNPAHTRNLMRFRPDLVQAVMQVPQRAGGMYPDAGAQAAAAQPTIVRFDEETLSVMRAHTEQLKRPQPAYITYDQVADSLSTVASIESEVTR